MSSSRLADDIRDCLQAALLLPEGTDAGVFHSGNLNKRVHIVTVSVSQGAVDSSSWDHISYVARQIAVILTQTMGVMYIGQNAQINWSVDFEGHEGNFEWYKFDCYVLELCFSDREGSGCMWNIHVEHDNKDTRRKATVLLQLENSGRFSDITCLELTPGLRAKAPDH
jgi:hypothetical protein